MPLSERDHEPLPPPRALAADLGPAVIADDPCEAAFGSVDPSGASKVRLSLKDDTRNRLGSPRHLAMLIVSRRPFASLILRRDRYLT
jgi:hypothetical protein